MTLKLNKHENVSSNTNPFDIDKYLNENWDNILKYAENINTEITSIKETNEDQDKNIKENTKSIEEIKEEAAEIKAENVRLRSDINSISLVGEAEGESIDLDDSSDARFLEFEIGGNHKQEIREGYNLLDFNVTQDNRVTYNEDGSITINGVGAFSLKFNQITLEANKTYKQKMELISGTIKDSSGNDVKDKAIMSFLADTWLNTTKSITYSKAEETLKSSAWVHQDAIFDNAKIKIWAYEGTEDKPYEQYGASPSQDYPSEVKTVGSNVNFLDDNLILYQGNYDESGNFFENNDRAIKDFIELNAGKYILWSKNNNWIHVLIYNENKGFERDIQSGSNKKEVIFELTSKSYIRFAFNPIVDSLTDFKLEKGTVATPYSPYNQGSVEVNVVNKNLLSLDKLVERTTQNFETEVKNGEYILNYFEKSYYIPIADNINLSKDIYHIAFYDFNIDPLSTEFGNIIFLDKNGEKITELWRGEWEKGVTINSSLQTMTIFSTDDTPRKLSFKVQIVKGDGTESPGYTPHQSQSYIMPVQQEMLADDYISSVEHHEWSKMIFDENSDMECTHNNKTFQFRFLKYLEGTDATTKVICNMAKYWNIGAWEENGCFISYNGYFYILCKENEFGFNANMTIDEAITHFKTILTNSKLIVYYKLVEPVDLELTDEQKAVAKQIKETLHTYKNVTHIFSNDEISPIFNIKYAKDPNVKNDNLQKQIDEIKQLLSTTQTSALLLDNLQKDVESEVE